MWRKAVWNHTLLFLKTGNSWMSKLVCTQRQVGMQPLAIHAHNIVRVCCCYHHVIESSSLNWCYLSQWSAETTVWTTTSSLLWRSHRLCTWFSTLHFVDLLLISLELLADIWNKAHLVWFWWRKRGWGCTALYFPPHFTRHTGCVLRRHQRLELDNKVHNCPRLKDVSSWSSLLSPTETTLLWEMNQGEISAHPHPKWN